MVRANQVLVLLAALGVGACDALLGSRSTDGPYAATQVYGFVTDSGGAPAAGLTVTIEARTVTGCASIRDEATAVTDASGHYAAILGNWGDPFDACVRVRAAPPLGASVRSDSSTRTPVRFGASGTDSTRIDLSLPPST